MFIWFIAQKVIYYQLNIFLIKNQYMIVFSKKSDRFFNYVSSQFNKEFSKSKDFMPIKGIVEAKLYFEKPSEEAKFVIQKDELDEKIIQEDIFRQLPDTMYYLK
ncbi:MAG: hypothetical protein ACI9O4_000983 [Chitinophagales bacterium]|jgi:hypothetical protein